MFRSIFMAAALASGIGLIAGTGCSGTEGVGDSCVPEQEYDLAFTGFNPKEVNVESKSFQCQTRICLVNHFQGRVSCPYGQSAEGTAVDGAKQPCFRPGTTDPISGRVDPEDPNSAYKNPVTQATVEAQCTERTKDKAVYCSCRCANIDGKKDDGANYCECPDGFACTQLVTSVGEGDTGLTGAYCIKTGTEFKPDESTCGPEGPHCDPALKNCGDDQLK